MSLVNSSDFESDNNQSRKLGIIERDNKLNQRQVRRKGNTDGQTHFYREFSRTIILWR